MKPKGSVTVIGGGIAGIQAGLTLSAAGYGVNIVERSAKLGGMIPELHRIYPLCACCKLDPRIAACEQDPNMNLFLNSEVQDISGQFGQFTVKLKTEGGEKSFETGAIVLAAGLETFEPTKYDTYAYGRFPNVITSVEYELMQKPQGPQDGIPKRPSDGKVPEKIAWLQCVGSREINRCDAPYCSSVCCMYALKEAVNTKDVNEDIDTSIFYMDMRTHGKGFEDYFNDAVSRGVNLVRTRVHTVDPIVDSDDLAITYADESGELHQEIFDLVVLSVGLRPSSDAIKLAQKIGVNLSEDQYIQAEPFQPVSTNLPGIFVCGGLLGPMDIGQSMIQATAAVSEIAATLEPQPFAAPKDYPKPGKDAGKKPQVLLATHLCPNMDPSLATEIEGYAKGLPNVALVSKVAGDILNDLVQKISESHANRLVFASCTPGVHKSLVEEALKSAGLNPYVYETVDLRVIDPRSVQAQLRDRIRMGVARATLISPPPLKGIPVVKSGLVVGGGVSGLESALALAKEGYPVTLIEKEKNLGGHGRHVRCTWNGLDVQGYLKALVSSVKSNPKIKIMTQTTVKENKGFAGNFVTTVLKKGKEKNIKHGVTILAAGGDPIEPHEYLYGQNKHVYRWDELSLKMIKDPSFGKKADSAVFIQCVGSREPQRPHCSNICCTVAVRMALDLKTNHPDMNVFILYREMRTFGERENLYKEARNKGIVFIRYDLENKPIVESLNRENKVKVTVVDPILGRPVEIKADFVSLQTAIAGSTLQNLAETFRIGLDQNGFFAESPEKLKPMDATSEGIYLAGLAHYPKDTGASITQARAAAARALEILRQDKIMVGGMVAEVNPEKCAVCCTCVRTCPFSVPYIDPERGAAYIDPGLCQGCGMCVAECPGKAIVMSTCSDQMLNQAPAILLASQ